MTLAAAVARLNTWTFTGLKYNLGVDWSRPPGNADLPALVVDLGVEVDFVEGLRADTLALASGEVRILLDHKLLVCGLIIGTPAARWADIITYVDRYLACVADDLTLNGNLNAPLVLQAVRMGRLEHLNGIYLGVVFRHDWKLRVT